ncbi:MAG: UxaA family hydrolase [Bacillota bacterium]|nr:UxaA family hydrolase [Bacillota bacterium]
MVRKAIVLHSEDNVATALKELHPGEEVQLELGTVTVAQDVPFGHKFAVRSLPKGSPVVKYGQVVGRVTQDVLVGQHVHVHNVESCRGRGDLAQRHDGGATDARG